MHQKVATGDRTSQIADIHLEHLRPPLRLSRGKLNLTWTPIKNKVGESGTVQGSSPT